MTIEYLKKGIDEKQRTEDNEKVKKVVEETLSKIENEGDNYIRELSEKFDNYSPSSFKLSENQIFELMDEVSDEDKEDIKFGQWRSPNKFSGEHHRTKKEIEKIVRDAGFKYNIIKHSGHSCIGDRWNIESLSVKYYFAMLSLL